MATRFQIQKLEERIAPSGCGGFRDDGHGKDHDDHGKARCGCPSQDNDFCMVTYSLFRWPDHWAALQADQGMDDH